MTESMIERVAQAIAVANRDEGGEGYRVLALAAIEAMREPTEAQLTAAEDIVVGWDDFACGDGNIYLGIPGYPDKTKRVWADLIDAALREETP